MILDYRWYPVFTVSYCRGSDFRTEYRNIAELRSIVPKNVNLMALTATVTPTTRDSIMESLCMDEENTFVLARVPNKLNIRYEAQVAKAIGN